MLYLVLTLLFAAPAVLLTAWFCHLNLGEIEFRRLLLSSGVTAEPYIALGAAGVMVLGAILSLFSTERS